MKLALRYFASLGMLFFVEQNLADLRCKYADCKEVLCAKLTLSQRQFSLVVNAKSILLWRKHTLQIQYYRFIL